MTKDKRVVTDFRHLNMHIAKNNLAYPLLKDTFLMLGSSKCKVMSVLDLKDAFHSLRLTENSKKFCGILPYFGSPSYLYQMMPMGLNISPPIWQSYINKILKCLQSRKYCEAIKDDLLLFTPTKASHFEKLEDLLKALHKNGLKIHLKVGTLRTSYKNMIILGDLNLHLNDPNDLVAGQFMENLEALGLYQCVTFPTHKSNNTLDVIISDIISKIKPIYVRAGEFISDHCFCQINV